MLSAGARPPGPSSVSRYREALTLGAAAVAILATRVVYLPRTLEDIDSVNFELGVHRFYPFADQPHPPGYPVFIALAKLVHPLFENHAAGLAFPSALCSALALVPLYALCRALSGRPQAALACALVIFNPLFWLNSVRPLSDVTGFASILGAQSLLVIAVTAMNDSPRRQRLTWCLGAVLAGLAIGVRVQAAVLVVPVLALGLVRIRRLRLLTIALFSAACAAWMLPTFAASGGVRRHLARQAQVVAEAWPSEPLVSRMTLERTLHGVTSILVSPWGSAWLAGGVLFAATAGLIVLWRRDRKTLGLVSCLFVPYAIYHYLLQTTDALRYAIPVLPLVVVPASMTFVRLVRDRTLGVAALAAAFIVVSARLTMPALGAYAGAPSPPADAVQYLRRLTQADPAPVVAGHYVFDRYLSQLSSSARIIRTKPNQEWRALNRFWVTGDHRPIWFLRDPARTTLRLKDPQAQTRIAAWQWPDTVRRFLRSARPARIELVRLDPPRWFAESGFLLTAEAGPPERVANERHLLFVRSDLAHHDVIVSGTSPGKADVTVVVDAQPQSRWRVDQSFSISVAVPPVPATEPYVPVRLDASTPLLLTGVSVGSGGGELALPVSGFYAPERDNLNEEFRWMGPQAAVTIPRSEAARRLTLRGLVPVERYHLPFTLQVEIPGLPPRTYPLAQRDFVVIIDLPETGFPQPTTVRLSTSESFVPDDVENNGDRRSLAVRIYDLHADPGNPADGDHPADPSIAPRTPRGR